MYPHTCTTVPATSSSAAPSPVVAGAPSFSLSLSLSHGRTGAGCTKCAALVGQREPNGNGNGTGTGHAVHQGEGDEGVWSGGEVCVGGHRFQFVYILCARQKVTARHTLHNTATPTRRTLARTHTHSQARQNREFLFYALCRLLLLTFRTLWIYFSGPLSTATAVFLNALLVF